MMSGTISDYDLLYSDPHSIERDDIRVEHIDLNGKQLLIVEGISPEEFDKFLPELRAWLESDHPVFVMYTNRGCKIRLEKIG